MLEYTGDALETLDMLLQERDEKGLQHQAEDAALAEDEAWSEAWQEFIETVDAEESQPKPEPATYDADGFPANVFAAALDALEWLRCFREIPEPRLNDQHRAALGRCISALEEHLRPHLPFVFQERDADDAAGVEMADKGGELG